MLAATYVSYLRDSLNPAARFRAPGEKILPCKYDLGSLTRYTIDPVEGGQSRCAGVTGASFLGLFLAWYREGARPSTLLSGRRGYDGHVE